MNNSIQAFEDHVLKELLDLDQLEIKTYMTVLQYPKITFMMLAKKCEIDRSKIYRVVSKFESLGLVEEVGGNPLKIIAVEPEFAIKKIIERKIMKIQQIDKNLDYVMKDLKELFNESKDFTSPRFAVIQGTENVYSRITNMIPRCKLFCDLIIPFNELQIQYFYKLPDVIEAAKIPIRIITNVKSKVEMNFAKQMKNCEIRFNKNMKGRMINTDIGSITELRMPIRKYHYKTEMNNTNLVTNADYTTEILKVYFSTLWKKSRVDHR